MSEDAIINKKRNLFSKSVGYCGHDTASNQVYVVVSLGYRHENPLETSEKQCQRPQPASESIQL